MVTAELPETAKLMSFIGKTLLRHALHFTSLYFVVVLRVPLSMVNNNYLYYSEILLAQSETQKLL